MEEICWSDFLNDDSDQDSVVLSCHGEPNGSFSGKIPSGTSLSPDPPKRRRLHRADICFVVREWLKAHAEDPYPTIEEKGGFAQSWGLTLKQVSDLFNNERRRSKWDGRSSIPHPIAIEKPSLTASSIGAVDFSGGESLLDRYLSSSSDEDPQSKEVVARIAAKMKEASISGQRENSSGLPYTKQNPGTTQGDSKVENSSISDILSVDGSSGQSSLTGSSYTSGKRGKRKTTTVRQTTSTEGRYYCTYCWRNFTSGTSWRKHEKTVHRPQKQFECRMADLTPTLQDCGACISPGGRGCRLSLSHNYKGCLNRAKEARIFNRKDHFQSHLKYFHNSRFTPVMETWVQLNSSNARSRCGYCCKWFPTWTERLDHIGNHYRYHSDFDRSKWQLNGDDQDNDRDCEAIFSPRDNKSHKEPSLILSRQQKDQKIEIDSFFDDYLTQKKVRQFLGSVTFFNDWQLDWKVLDFSRSQLSASNGEIHSEKTFIQDAIGPPRHDTSTVSQVGRSNFDLQLLQDLTVHMGAWI